MQEEAIRVLALMGSLPCTRKHSSISSWLLTELKRLPSLGAAMAISGSFLYAIVKADEKRVAQGQ